MRRRVVALRAARSLVAFWAIGVAGERSGGGAGREKGSGCGEDGGNWGGFGGVSDGGHVTFVIYFWERGRGAIV